MSQFLSQAYRVEIIIQTINTNNNNKTSPICPKIFHPVFHAEVKNDKFLNSLKSANIKKSMLYRLGTRKSYSLKKY